jgi:lipoyl(octanoyl) transferase
MAIIHIDLGLTNYNEVWELQKELHSKKINGLQDDFIITTQHKNVYTLGKTGSRNHILYSNEELIKNQIEFFEIDRGGDITYHGPGQLVVYPIIDLSKHYKDIHRYLRELEEIVILTLKHFVIDAYSDNEFTGVWVNDEKICAIGIKVSRWITMHGIALNVNTDLNFFGKIIPCGIFHKGVTSIEKIKGKKINIEKVKQLLIKYFYEKFNNPKKPI